jgi:3-deoxy-7-phosphoheptulonate synthase
VYRTQVGPSTVAAELVQLINRLDPTGTPGNVTLITRFGEKKVAAMLPPIIQAVQAAGLPVVWVVSERFPLTPLQYWLCTPELQ